MNSIKKVFSCALVNFKKWQAEPRIWFVFATIFLYTVYLFADVVSFATSHDQIVPIWVGFTYFSNSFIRVIYGLLVGILFCSAPFYERYSTFFVVRTGRLSWILGQIVYIVLASFLLALALYASVFIVILRRFGIADGWGVVLMTMAENPGATGIGTVFVNSAISRFSPLLTNVAAFGLIWLVSTFVGVFFTAFQLLFKRVVSFSLYGLLLFLVLSAELLGMLNWGTAIRYVSPLSFLSLSFFREFNGDSGFPPMYYGFFLLGALTLVMAVLATWRFCARDLDNLEKEE